MVSLSQRLSRSSALTSACLHVHVGRALLFSFPCRSQRCHDISRIGSSHPHCVARTRHTFPKLKARSSWATQRYTTFGTASWRATRSHRKRHRKRDHLSGQVFARRRSTRLPQSQIGMRRRRDKLTETRWQVCVCVDQVEQRSELLPSSKNTLHNLVGLAVVVYIDKPRERRCML